MEILPIITEGISLIESEKPKIIGIYYPSEFGYCIRKSYYSYLYAERHELETHKNFAVGSAFHFIIQKGLDFYAKEHQDVKVTNEKADIKEEFYYKIDGIELHGRPDSIIMTDKGIHLLEIKSHSSISEHYLSVPQENHLHQINYYLHFYPKAEGHIIYMNKAKNNGGDYQEFKEFANIFYDEDKFKAVVQWGLSLHTSLITNKLPEPEAYLKDGWEGWQCKRCPAKKRCMKEVKLAKANT